MAARTCRVGLHGRNNVTFEEADYQVIQTARIEAVKMMGQTRPAVFKRLKAENPTIELITRLYDDRFGKDTHPSPEEFVESQRPIIRKLRPYCTKFEIHNEPNHRDRYEGWGEEDHHAEDFNNWFLEVYNLLKKEFPWASFGFPGLAIPHRDLEWIEICRPAIERADWLGVHCYWQTPAGQERNHLADFWGLRFKYYHQKFPGKILEITECGNSNIQANPPIPITEEELARQYVEYYQELFKYSYINSACFFILSSQDATWDFFSWRTESGHVKKVVEAVGKMERPPLAAPRPAFPRPTLTSAPTPTSATTAITTIRLGGGGGLPGVQVADITDSLPRHPTARYPTRPLSAIRQIIIHHTALSEKIGPQRIAQAQVKRLGKAGITCHYFIAEDGTIYQTNPPTVQTDHTAGHNRSSVAIAFAGNFTAAIPTPAQIRAGGQLCAALMVQFNIPPENIKGASELIPTQSPGRQWLKGQRWKDRLLAEIARARGITAPAPTAEPAPALVQLNARIAELTAQLAAAQAENEADDARIAALSNRIARLEAELARARTAAPVAPLPEASGEIASLKERIAELELQLAFGQESAATADATRPAPAQPTAVPRPPIQDIAASLPRHPANRYPTRSTTDIRTIVVHHTGVSPAISAADIAGFSVTRQGWPGIGFHFFITAGGDIQQTNPLTTISYHAGAQNAAAVGVAFAGKFTAGVPTAAQIEAGGQLIAWLLSTLGLSLDAVKGHKELTDTPCPGDQWDAGTAWRQTLRQAIRSNLGPAAPAPSAGGGAAQPVFHYLLFPPAADGGQASLQAAASYIARFQPKVGFSVDEATAARYVTIVGGPQGITPADEARLRAAGCRVERIGANTIPALKALFDNLARTNRRFLTLQAQETP